ncbi:MAG: endonuclease III [Planctomycetota bacterium]|jgi:endonuclease-3
MGGSSGAKRRPRGYRARRHTKATRERAAEVVRLLKVRYPDAECALVHRNAYELVVATVLSAQCTDERVNRVTPDFFHRWPTPAALARAPRDEVEEVIHSTGFFRNKAKNLQEMAARVTEDYGGEVPEAMDDLLTLGGVARKTANVVRGVIWGLADGVVVDTHVQRISKLLGWTKAENAVHVEKDLMALHPQEDWIAISHLLIHHGRQICIARRPKCGECPVSALCPSGKEP